MAEKKIFNFGLHSNVAPKPGHTPYNVPWKNCFVCDSTDTNFQSPREFCRHLRDFHCAKEGGSFVCKYGKNGVCPSLPVEGVSDRDYEDHVARDHVAGESRANYSKSNSQDGSQVTPVHTPSQEPSVVLDQHKWTPYMSKVNLPAALNDPRLSRRETDFFTKTWGEGFEKTNVSPAAHLPQITKEHFRKYLKQTSARLKEHQSLSSDNEASSTAISQNDFPAFLAKKRDKHQIEFEQLPKIFLHQGFNLENPDTFNAVFPWTQVESSHQGGKGVPSGKKPQSSKLLQEKLSHYLDVVEVQIAKQISYRSEAFFHAMTSHDKLQENMTSTCASIKKLRDRVCQMEHVMTQGPLKVIKLQKLKSNYACLYNKLKLMSTVHQTQPTIQLLLANSEFVGALDLISTTQEVLAQELQGLVCFRHLGSQLAELEKLIDKMMQEDFAKYANLDLNRPVEEGYSIVEEERLVSIVLGMLRQHKQNFIDVYREEAFTSLKAILKQTVIEAVSVADAIPDPDPNAVRQALHIFVSGSIQNHFNLYPKGDNLADQMRQLGYTRWMVLLRKVFDNLKVILMRVKAVSEIMLEVTQLAAGLTDQSLESIAAQRRDSIFDQTLILNNQQSSSVAIGTTNNHQLKPIKEDQSTEQEQEDSSPLVNSEVSNSIPNGDVENGVDGRSDVREKDSSYMTTEDVQVSTTTTSAKSVCSSTSRISVCADIDVMITEAELMRLSQHVREMVCHVCDHAHSRCEKLLVARSKDGFLERLNSVEFVELSRTVEEFVCDCEGICGRKSTSLRSCLQSQAIKFVSRFHDERKNKLSLILDNERWKQADVPAEFQDLVNHINQSDKLNLPKKSIQTDRQPGEYLFIGKEKYAVVGTVLMLLKMVVEYCECVVDIPSATPDILTRLIELLKMFNSRSCQLILGAGALQLVGLKTITTKNLALASRCLQLVVKYLPKVRNHFEVRLQGKQKNMLKHFDHILKDYKDHIAELSNKLVAIMDIMFDSHLPKPMEAFDTKFTLPPWRFLWDCNRRLSHKWEVRAPMPSTCFRSMCKQITKLYEAIIDLLPQEQVLEIFQRVHSSFKIHLRSQLIKLGVTNDGGPQHGLVMSDVAFYEGSLKALQGVSQILNSGMNTIWDKG